MISIEKLLGPSDRSTFDVITCFYFLLRHKDELQGMMFSKCLNDQYQEATVNYCANYYIEDSRHGDAKI